MKTKLIVLGNHFFKVIPVFEIKRDLLTKPLQLYFWCNHHLPRIPPGSWSSSQKRPNVWTAKEKAQQEHFKKRHSRNKCTERIRLYRGSGDSSVVREPHSWLKGRGFESLQERREIFFSRVNFLCWLSFLYPFHPRVTGVKDHGHSAKSAGGRLQLNTHTPYVCGFAWSDMVHGCMVYTELAPRWLQFHVAPAMPAL